MKKVCKLVLVLTLALSMLVGCAAPAVTTTEQDETKKEVQTTTQAPDVKETVEETEAQEDDSVVFVPGYRFPSLLGFKEEERTEAAIAKNAYVQADSTKEL